MIIVEGADGTGKSTLCRNLLDRLGEEYVYAHLSRPPEGFDVWYGHLGMINRFTVQDRFHMGEIVWPHARGEAVGTWRMQPETYRLLDARLRLVGSFTVVLTCWHDQLAERLAKSEHMYDQTTILRANNAYLDIVNTGRFGLYRPDYDYVVRETQFHPYPSSSDVNDIVHQYLQRQKEIDERTPKN